MKLNWMYWENRKELPLDPNRVAAPDYKGDATAEWGVFKLIITCNLRVYKDGTRQWMSYLRVPCADSREIITLCKTRGNCLEAIEATERFLFDDWNGNELKY